MPTLEVRCGSDPLAELLVRDARLMLIGQGNGLLTLDVPVGLYEVVAAAASWRAERIVKIGADRLPAVELAAPSEAVAPPALLGWADIDALDTTRASSPAAESEIVVATGRATSRGDPAHSTIVGRLVSATSPWSAGVTWHHRRRGDVEVSSVGVAAGSYALMISRPVRVALQVPAWHGWRTLVFLPTADEWTAGLEVSMHCTPLGFPWVPDRSAELVEQLQWALTSRRRVTSVGLRMFEAAAVAAASAHRGTVSPLTSIMLANLAFAAGDVEVGRRQRDAARSFERTSTVAAADLIALDVLDAETAAAGEPSAVPTTVAVPPVLGLSADALLRNEVRMPGRASLRAAEVLAARVTSPVWFQWSGPTVQVDTPDTAPSQPVDAAWTAARRRLRPRHLGVARLERTLARRRDDPALERLVTYLLEESFVHDRSPAEVLATADLPTLVAGTCVPAAALVRALPRIVPRRRWLRRLTAGTVLVVAGIVATLIAWPDDRAPTRETGASVGSEAGTEPTDRETIPEATPGPVTGNRAPVAQDDLQSVVEDVATDLDVLANDRDPDGDPLTIVSATDGELGTTEVVGDLIRYTPNPDVADVDRFSYVVRDSDGAESTAVVGVGITPVNDPPVAEPDVIELVVGESVFLRVLANDVDVEGDTLRARMTTQPRGKVVDTSDGDLEYIAGTEPGTDVFTYVADDGSSSSNEATVELTIYPKVDVGDPTIFEGGDPRSLGIELSAASADPIEVGYVVRAATPDEAGTSPIATPDVDFVPTSGTVAFRAGETGTAFDIEVPFNNDVPGDDNADPEVFVVELTVRYVGGLVRTMPFTISILEQVIG